MIFTYETSVAYAYACACACACAYASFSPCFCSQNLFQTYVLLIASQSTFHQFVLELIEF